MEPAVAATAAASPPGAPASITVHAPRGGGFAAWLGLHPARQDVPGGQKLPSATGAVGSISSDIDPIPTPVHIAVAVGTSIMSNSPFGLMSAIFLGLAQDLFEMGPDTTRAAVPQGMSQASEAGMQPVSPGTLAAKQYTSLATTPPAYLFQGDAPAFEKDPALPGGTILPPPPAPATDPALLDAAASAGAGVAAAAPVPIALQAAAPAAAEAAASPAVATVAAKHALPLLPIGDASPEMGGGGPPPLLASVQAPPVSDRVLALSPYRQSMLLERGLG